MKNILKLKNSIFTTLMVLLCLLGFIGCSSTDTPSTNNNGQVVENSNSNNVPLTNQTDNTSSNNINISNINDIPAYSGNDTIILNNNVPNFSNLT